MHIKASAEQARKIAEDEAVDSVTQNRDAGIIIPTTGLTIKPNGTPASNVEPVKGKRPNPDQKQPSKSDQPDS